MAKKEVKYRLSQFINGEHINDRGCWKLQSAIMSNDTAFVYTKEDVSKYCPDCTGADRCKSLLSNAIPNKRFKP